MRYFRLLGSHFRHLKISISKMMEQTTLTEVACKKLLWIQAPRMLF